MINKKETSEHLQKMNAILKAKADKFALSLEDVLDPLRASDLTHHKIAEKLNEQGLRTPRGHFWMYKSVRDVCTRLDAIRKAVVVAEAPDTLELDTYV